MNRTFARQATKAKVLRQETKNRVSKDQSASQPKLAYDSIKSLQKLRTRLILEESNQVYLKEFKQSNEKLDNNEDIINNIVDEIYDASKEEIEKDVMKITKLLESKRCRPADMYLQSKLMLRLNEREEKVKETIRGIREKLKQNKKEIIRQNTMHNQALKKRERLNETIEKLKEKWATKNSPKPIKDESEVSWKDDQNSPNADLKLQLEDTINTKSNKILKFSKSNKSFDSDHYRQKHIVFKTNNQ